MTQYWHGSSDGVVWHPNGSNLTYSESDDRIRPELIDHSLKMDQGVFEVGGDVFMAYGFGLTSPAMIVGPDGVIIVDPPEDVEKGRQAWEQPTRSDELMDSTSLFLTGNTDTVYVSAILDLERDGPTDTSSPSRRLP